MSSGTFINPNWSETAQIEAAAKIADLTLRFTTAYEALIHNPPTPEWKQPVLNILAEWRDYNESLSKVLFEQDSTVIDTIGPLAEQVVEQKEILKKLQGIAGTRDDQVSSLNPKSTPSPYVNMLGLQRTFRPGTRTAILWTGVFFGFLTLCVLSAMIFMFVTRGFVATPVMVGGSKHVRFAPDT
jgi:hypothetical protein